MKLLNKVMFALMGLLLAAPAWATPSAQTNMKVNYLHVTKDLTVNGTATFGGTSSIVLKGISYNGTLIVAPAIGQATTFTFPDPGSASASVVLNKADTSIAGIKTFTDGITLGAGAVLDVSVGTVTGALGQGVSDGSAHTVTIGSATQSGNVALNIPAITTGDTLMTLGTVQTVTGAKTMSGANIIKFANTGLQVLDTGANLVTIVPAAQSAGVTLNIPAIVSGDTVATLGTVQTVTGAKTMSGANVITHANAGALIQNPAGTFTVQLTPSAELANRVLTIPLLGGSDTLMTLGTAQSNTGVKTFADNTCLNSMGSGSGTYVPSGVMNMQVNSFSTTTGTGGQVGHTYSLPANSLVDNGRGIRIRAWGHTAANANNKTVQINFGASTYTTGAIGANGKDYYIEVTVVRTGSNAQTWVAQGYANALPISFAGSATTGTLTQTESGAITISTTLTDGTSSAGDIVESGFEVDAL